MDRSEGESGRRNAAPTSPSRREAARREQARRDKKKRPSRCEPRGQTVAKLQGPHHSTGPITYIIHFYVYRKTFRRFAENSAEIAENRTAVRITPFLSKTAFELFRHISREIICI